MSKEWVDCLNQSVGLTNGVSERNRFLTQLNAALYCTANDPQKRTILAMRESIVQAFDRFALENLSRARKVLDNLRYKSGLCYSNPAKEIAKHYLNPLADFYLGLGMGSSTPRTETQYIILLDQAVMTANAGTYDVYLANLTRTESLNAIDALSPSMPTPLFPVAFKKLSSVRSGQDSCLAEMLAADLEDAFLRSVPDYCEGLTPSFFGQLLAFNAASPLDAQALATREKVKQTLQNIAYTPLNRGNDMTATRLLKKHFGHSASQPFRSLSFKGKFERLCRFEV